MSFQADPTLTWKAVTHGTYFMGLLGQHISALSETHLFCSAWNLIVLSDTHEFIHWHGVLFGEIAFI